MAPSDHGEASADPYELTRAVTDLAVDESLVARARTLEPIIRQYADTTERSRLERHFRDAQTVRHHGFLSESRLETVGQVYLGIEPEFGFVAF